MPPHNLGDTLGAVLIGSGFAAGLSGVVAAQVAYYFRHYRDDMPSRKLMVSVVWFLDILHTVMIFASDWSWLITHSGDHGISNSIPWSLGITILLTAMVTIIAHCFFAFRIYGLSRGNWFVVGPILALAVLRLGFGTTSCAKMLIYATFETFADNAAWMITAGLVNSSVLDVVTTSSLIWYLDNARTGFEGMNQIVNILSLYALENGLLTSVAAVTSLGCWLGMRHNLIFMAIHFVVAKLYANSLLAALNSRNYIRGRSRAASLSGGPQRVTGSNPRRATTLKHPSSHIGAVEISVEKSFIRHDEGDIGLSQIKYQETMRSESVETTEALKTAIV